LWQYLGQPKREQAAKVWKELQQLKTNKSPVLPMLPILVTDEHKKKWLGVDFDGTLATWGCNWLGDYHATGQPIPRMVDRVKKWIAEGEDVRIFTARMDGYHPTAGHVPAHVSRQIIEDWCLKHLGFILPVTNRKDYFCKAIYDDRAYRVEKDTGRLLGEE
jgi:hypothetical protein